MQNWCHKKIMAKSKKINKMSVLQLNERGLNTNEIKTAVNSTELFVSSYESFMKKHLFGFEIRGGKLRRSSSLEEPSLASESKDSLKVHNKPSVSFKDEQLIERSFNQILDVRKSKDRNPFKEKQRSEDLKEKICEPRALYAEWSQPGPQHLPRWPIEMIVLDERVKHKYFHTNERQPFLKPASGIDAMPVPVISRTSGRLVYHYKPSGSSSFVRSCVGGSRDGKFFSRLEPKHSEDTLLVFESRFESANLEKVVQISKYSYELYLRNDLYNWNQTQWFYFRVSNTRSGPSYRFSIVNLSKQGSLYRNGMQPLLYSNRMAEDDSVGWHRAGFDILYCRNQYLQEDNVQSYTFSFSVKFPYDNDNVYFAHCYPYTYSDLQDYLLSMQQKESLSKICRQRILCWSLAGNLVPLVTITSPETEKKKKVIVISSRVHPGESNSSWVVKGVLDFLLSDNTNAKLLRSSFIFKIIPMLNPDGVIVGNYRCSLTGRDLNRQYRSVLKNAFPSIWYTRQLIQRLKETSQVFLYCDIHGHSRKPSVFLYGCENGSTSNSHLHEWIFPYLFQKNSTDTFSMENCSSKVQRCRVGTGRITIWKMGIPNSYTLEASMGGVLNGQAIEHITISDYEDCGKNLCEALYEYHCASVSKINHVLLTIRELIQQNVIGNLDDLENGNASDCEFDIVEDLAKSVSKVTTKESKSTVKRKSRKESKTSRLTNERKYKSSTR